MINSKLIAAVTFTDALGAGADAASAADFAARP